MKTLFKNTPNELQITEVGNRIIVKNKEDLRIEALRKEQQRFILNHLVLIATSIILGICIAYLLWF